MGILEEYTGNRGPMYQVGYGIGALCTTWRIAKKLLSAGCCVDNISQVLEIPAEHVEAARKLGCNEDAYEVLFDEVSSIVDVAYEELLDSPLKVAVSLVECDQAKSSIEDVQIIS